MNDRVLAVAVALNLALGGCATAGASSFAPMPCDGSTEASRRLVIAFYNEGLVGRQPQAAFSRYMAPDFVEHKPDVPQGTRDATASFLAQIMTDVPDAKWEIVRTIADRDMVFLHGRFTPAPGAPVYALADIFSSARLQDSRTLGRCCRSAKRTAKP